MASFLLLSELSFLESLPPNRSLKNFLILPQNPLSSLLSSELQSEEVSELSELLEEVVGRIQCTVSYDIITECTVIRIVDDSAIGAVTAAEDTFDGIPEVGEESAHSFRQCCSVYSSEL